MLRRQALVKERSRRSVKGLKQQRSRAEEGVLGVGLQKTAEMDEVCYPFRRLGANAVNGGKRRPRAPKGGRIARHRRTGSAYKLERVMGHYYLQ